MKTTTYGDAIQQGDTRVYSLPHGCIVILRLLFGRVQITLEDGCSRTESVDAKFTYLPADWE